MNLIKKYLKLFSIIIICITIFFIFKLNNKNNITYLSLGDSFALGKNAYGQIDYGYSDYVKDYLSANKRLNKYIKSFSKKDASINSLYQDIVINRQIKINNKKYNIKQMLRESDILTISIGLNDLIYKLSIEQNCSKETITRITLEIENDFNKLISEIKKYYHNEIYVVGYYNIYPENNIYEESIIKLNNIYKNNQDIVYIDISKMSYNKNKYVPFFMNYFPSRSGYKLISEEIIKKISKKLEK